MKPFLRSVFVAIHFEMLLLDVIANYYFP
jgi:hypothetical protein